MFGHSLFALFFFTFKIFYTKSITNRQARRCPSFLQSKKWKTHFTSFGIVIIKVTLTF